MYVNYNLSRILFTIALLGIPYVFFNYVFAVGLIVLVYKVAVWILDRRTGRSVDVSGKGVFITGCDSGLYTSQ